MVAVAGQRMRFFLVLVPVAAVALALPVFLDNYQMYLVNAIGVYAIAGLGLNVVTGYAGLISLGHAAFFAVGAYTSGILVATYGWPFWMALPVAGVADLLLGLIGSAPVVRLQGHYLGISTLALSVIVQQLLFEAEWLTGGRSGLAVPTPVIFGFRLSDDHSYYYVVLAVGVVAFAIAGLVTHSYIGRAWRALRDNEVAAQAAGVDLARFKLYSFLFGALLGGTAGGLYSNLIKHLSVGNFGLLMSITFLMMIVVGGLGSLRGCLLGAAYIALAPEVFRNLAEMQMIVYGLILIAVMLYLPKGLAGLPEVLGQVARARWRGAGR